MVGVGPRKPPSRKGSMHDVPRELSKEIERFEELFTVGKEQLEKISDNFCKALEKGLSKEGGDIPMIPTWVMGFPDGMEKGRYLALDLGGTNLRVCEIDLEGNGKFDMIQSKYRLPDDAKTGSADGLFDYIAECVEKFLEYLKSTHKEENVGKLHLGFTFSYPVSQEAIDHGVLQRWTKGFDIDGVEGQDVVPIFEKALKKRHIDIELTALINDTTGTMIATSYAHKKAKIGCIFGTGCNAAYMETVDCIPKLDHLDVPGDTPMAINCEWGAYDNVHEVLPRTVYDKQIDTDSPRPGQQTFEKMIAGLYLGEVVRLALVDLTDQNYIFENQNITKIRKPYIMDASVLSEIELDPFENLMETHTLFEIKYGIHCTEPERKLIRRLAELIGTRAARLSACGIAAICKKKNYSDIDVGADGSVFNKYPLFKQRLDEALKEIFGDRKINTIAAEDGSGVGAALITCLTLKRVEHGLKAGVKKADN